MQTNDLLKDKFCLLNNVPYGACVLDDDLKVAFWNYVLNDWSCLPPETVLGKYIGDIFPRLNEKRYINRLRDAIAGGPPAIFSPQLHPQFFPFKKIDGSYRILRTIATKIVFPGIPGNFLLLTVDDFSMQVQQVQQIAELRQKALDEVEVRKRAEVALRASEAKFRAHFKAIPLPTYSWEYRGGSFVFMDYNDAALTETGGKIDDLVGSIADEFFHDNPEIVKSLEKCYFEKTEVSREIVYKMITTGQQKNLAVKFAFVPPNSVMIHTDDITDRMKYLQERENLILKLKQALEKIKTLKGLIPICASCKKIRNDQGFWLQVEEYIGAHSDVEFSHGICPDCMEKLYPEYKALLDNSGD